jgi:hypothetical protein
VTAEQMNPRNVTRRTSVDERPPASAAASPGRRFRWGTVPAALSWCFGGGALIAIPFGAYQALQMLPLPAGAGPAERMMVHASLVMIPCLIVAGGLNCLAGTRWLRGRWIQALLLNAGACGIMAIPQWMHDAALTAARNV